MRYLSILLFAGSLYAQWPTANLACHWRADSLPDSNGASVSSAADTEHGYTATQATTAKQPTMVFNASGFNGHKVLRFVEANAQTLTISSSCVVSNASTYSVFVIARPYTVDSGSAGVMINVGTTLQGRFYYNNYAELGYFGVQGDMTLGGITIPSQVALLGLNSTGSSLVFSTNESTKTGSSFANATTLTGGFIGSDGTGNFINMDVAEVFIYSPEISSGNFTALKTYTNTTYGSTTMRRAIIAEGNSLTDGVQLTAGQEPWPSTMVDSMNPNVRMYNVGFSGETTATMITASPVHVIPLCNQTTHDTAFLWEGTNDITVTHDGTVSYNNMMTLAGLFKAAGCVPIIGTTIKAVQLAGGDETQRVVQNNLLLAQKDYIIVDLAALSQFSNTSDATYYQADGTHLKPAGQAVVAANVLTAMNDYGTSTNGARLLGVTLQ